MPTRLGREAAGGDGTVDSGCVQKAVRGMDAEPGAPMDGFTASFGTHPESAGTSPMLIA